MGPAASVRATPTDLVERQLRGRRTSVGGLAFEAGVLLALLLCLGVLVWLLATVLVDGVPVVADRGTDLFTGELAATAERTGLAQGIFGSLGILLFVAVLSFPIGVGAAVYLEEYAGDTRFTRFVNVNIRNLAGVPSVVYGLLGLAIFVEAMGEVTGPSSNGRSLVAGGLTMAVLVLPIVVITAAEALRAVPGSLREAGFAVGATRWEVTRGHVLPYAAPGILTGTVLAFSRAVGEAAPLIVIGAVTGLIIRGEQGLAERFQDRFTALPMEIYTFTRNFREGYLDLASATIVVLLGVLLLANTAAILLRNRYDKRRQP
ncbi:MAG TPA: phosphate ABC transporter permease PstA [Acidimicrobiales bacterium]|jgi:phosphate transport system permease protein